MVGCGGIAHSNVVDLETKGCSMTLLSPLWLFALLIIIAYIVGVRRYGWNTQKWHLATLFFLILALSRPVTLEKPIRVEESGSDVILAIDVSYSMRATDIAPNRLEAAKQLLLQLIHSDKQERFGVIAHTTSAIILSPLTKDTQLLEHLFSTLDESQIITKGTDVMSALELARKMSHAKNPLVVLLTDGGDNQNYDKEKAFAQDNGLNICVVMLASSSGSTLPAENGALKDDQGHIAVSSRNDAIKEISSHFIEGADARSVLHWIQTQKSDNFTGSSMVQRHGELFYIPLMLALLTFLMAHTTLGKKVLTMKVSKKLVAVLALVGINLSAGVLDYPNAIIAKHYFEQENYETSAQWYQKIASNEGKFNTANAYYKAGKYQEALGVYRTIRTHDSTFKSKIFYNIGNCHIRLSEFDNARNAFLKSLTLRYTKEADKNLQAIMGEKEQQTLNVRKEKKDQFSSDENKPTGEKKNGKEGGGSNMQSDIATSGAGDALKKTQGDPRFSTSQGKAALSSRQYELINQRAVHETKPW
jgi:Ca-activated chloride channel homolog